jgi:hypothetical protein
VTVLEKGISNIKRSKIKRIRRSRDLIKSIDVDSIEEIVLIYTKFKYYFYISKLLGVGLYLRTFLMRVRFQLFKHQVLVYTIMLGNICSI